MMHREFIVAISAFALMSGVALAQSPGAPAAAPGQDQNHANPTTATTAPPNAADNTAVNNTAVTAPGESSAGLASVDRLMGKNVLGKDGEKLGEVDDVILGPNGEARQLVLARGGFLGIGERKVAVDFNEVQSRPDDESLHIAAMTQEDVRNMPEFQYDDSMTSLNRNQAGDTIRSTDQPAATGTPETPPAPPSGGATTSQ